MNEFSDDTIRRNARLLQWRDVPPLTWPELQAMRMDSLEQRVANLERATTKRAVGVSASDRLVIMLAYLSDWLKALGLKLFVTPLNRLIVVLIILSARREG